MQFMWFTERAYHDVPEEAVLRNRSFFGLSNKYFDPKKGSAYLNQYIDEKVYTDEELPEFDCVMLNEHHGTPFCMGAVMDVEASILARVTKRVKIVLLGNPIPTVANPLRLAEELAMIDLISEGRLVPGWVRGAGSEQIANNANPAYNREYFEEGHDLILQAWTREGPFRFEGKHFHFRHVNPWVKPYQQPHPPIWIPGLVSPDTAIWCAKKRYPYVALATYLEPTTELWNIYAKAAAAEGYQAGSENFGYMQPVFVSKDRNHAIEMGKRFLFGGGFAHFARAEWMFPPGYNSKEATRRMARQFANPNLPGKSIMPAEMDEDSFDYEAAKQEIHGRYEENRRALQMVAGTPDDVIPQLKKVIDVLRPGIFSFWLDGPVPAADRRECLRLLAKEVVPALRDYGKEIGIVDPFERKPGSRPLAGEAPEPVAWPEMLPAA
jgi:alkanesulfonate monooxygenase SsuD/methylene tetrahydromethanopterin reductase-like flavin-dependent oxidoreductase (luciferase family)